MPDITDGRARGAGVRCAALAVLACLLLAALPAAPARAQATASQPAASTPGVHLRQVTGMDNQGFGQPMPAFSLMVPQHWQTEGGVIWSQSDPCNSMGYNFAFAAAAPDRRFGVAVLPSLSWSVTYGLAGGTPGPCPQADLRSAQAFLQWYVPQLQPGARFLDYRARPDLLQGSEGMIGRTDIGGGAYMETAVDAGEILFAYDEAGQAMRGSVAALVVLWHTHMPGMPSMMQGVPGIPPTDVFGGSNLPAFGAFAPEGALDLRTAETIRLSFAPAPEWSRRIAEHHAIINRTNRQGAIDRHNINMRANREIGEIINRGYKERSEMQDRSHREFMEYVRGVETYDDPMRGGTVELDSSYRNAWQLSDGTYFLTDDDSFIPHATLGIDGQRLEATR